MSALKKVSRFLRNNVVLPLATIAIGSTGMALYSVEQTNAQQPNIPTLYDEFGIGSVAQHADQTGSFASGRNDGYAHQENQGAGQNGAGTANLQVRQQGFSGFPNGIHGETSYVDGGGGRQRVDFTHPDDQRRPVIVFIHGGGWRGDGGQYNQQFRERVAEHGFASFRIRYRLIANGTYGIFNDVMNSIEHLRNNADTYNIDPNRIITWGDSAGGSLSVRTGASGKAGTSTSVGWSAPTNAFRSFLFSPASLAIGFDHATCFDTGFTDIAGDLMEIYRPWDYLLQDPERLQNLSPQELIGFAQASFQAVQVIQDNDVVGQLQSSLAEWGIDVNRLTNAYSVARDSANRLNESADSFNPSEANTQTDTPASNSDLQKFKDDIAVVIEGLGTSGNDSATIKSAQERLQGVLDDLPENPGEEGNITLEEGKQIVQEVANDLESAAGSSDINQEGSIINDVRNSAEENPSNKAETPPTDEEALRAHLAMISDEASVSLNDALGAVREGNQRGDLTEEQAAELQSLSEVSQRVTSAMQDNTNSFTRETNSGGSSGNIQFNPVEKISECVDNLIQTSPALFASPNSPPMFLANASHETLVPPEDAYEMRNKIQSFGTQAEVLILEGANHMGYDERAVEPTLRFLRQVNHPPAVNR